MKLVFPVDIVDARLVASNIVEQTPRAAAATSHALWDSTSTYALDQEVCWAWTTSDFATLNNHLDPTLKLLGRGQNYFGLFTSKYAGNLNREPAKSIYDGGATQPGSYFWTSGVYAPQWDSTTTYAIGTTVGRVNGATGAFYQSLVAGNTGNDPISSPASWRQTTANAFAEWSSGTTYADDAQVCITIGSVVSVYTSLQAGNLNHNPANSPTWWNYEGDTYREWSSLTTYAKNDIVIDLRTHHAYQSFIDSNTNNDPTLEANQVDKWLDLGLNNRWAMFDTSSSSQSVYGETIDITVAPGQVCDTLALLNCRASSVRVTVLTNDESIYINMLASETLDSRITASGGANGTRVNSAGLIEAAVCPRFDYDPVTLEPLGPLVEGARTNVLLQSENLATTWVADGGASIVYHAATAPSGQITADKLKESGATSIFRVYQLMTLSVATVYTLSFYAKADGRDAVFIYIDEGQTIGIINLATNVGTPIVGSPTFAFTEGPEGFTRVSMTFTNSTVGLQSVQFSLYNGAVTYAGDNVSGMLFWGIQCEAGAEATSYIPTTTATVTRTADALTMTGTDFSDWFNPVEGTFFIEASILAADDLYKPFITVDDSSMANSMVLAHTSGVFYMNVTVASVEEADAIIAGTAVAGVPFRGAFAYKANDVAGCFDGGVVATATTTPIPSGLNRLYIGAYGAYNVNGHIRKIIYHPTRKTNAFLVNETTEFSNYDVTVDLTDDSMITTYRNWFFDPVRYRADALFTDLPLVNTQFRIIASMPDGEVAMGAVLFGLSETLGFTLVGASNGIRDYSRKVFDDFGNATFVERGFAKTAQMKVKIVDGQYDAVMNRIAERRAVPSLWLGTDRFANFWVHGIPRDHRGEFDGPIPATFDIEIEGIV